MNEPVTTSSQPRRRETRRDELLDAAAQLFRERGVAATTVSQITDAAGVAKGTFYLYFDSKDHLVAGLQDRLMAGMSQLVVDALERLGDGDYFALADELVAAIIDYWIDHREIHRAITESGESRETADLLAEYDERVVGMLEAGVQIGIDRGLVEVSDPRGAALFMFYGCKGATDRALLARDEIDRDQLVHSAQEIVRKILAT